VSGAAAINDQQKSRLDRIGTLLDKLPTGEGLRYYHAGHELADAREALQALRAEPPGWRCFHCDEMFTDWGEARNHFGYTPDDGPPACKTTRGEDSELYHLKRQLEAYRNEDTELDDAKLHPESAAEEIEATRDMLNDARTELDMIREALGVPVEPHQTLSERVLEAAQRTSHEPEPDESDADTCRLAFQEWANNLDLCLDEIFMSSTGVPEHPYEDDDTNQFWRAWLASWKAKRAAQQPGVLPTLDEFIELLQSAGWRSTYDAQWEGVAKVHGELFGATSTKCEGRSDG
jgi:hypothetical protein